MMEKGLILLFWGRLSDECGPKEEKLFKKIKLFKKKTDES